MQTVLALVLIAGAQASSLGLLADDSVARNPTSLAQHYATEIPKVGALMPKELLREHMRRDLMPRLMTTQDDRTAFELGLNIYEKLNARAPSLLELHNRIGSGKKISHAEGKELQEAHQDLTNDIELLGNKIQDDGTSSSVSFNALKLMANSAQSFACAFFATEIEILSRGTETKKDCTMPFPGSLIMLDQKISVPQKLSVITPPEGDEARLQPQQWMAEHLRRKVWCPNSFQEHGFDADPICDAISSALDMPQHDEIAAERSSLAQISTSIEKGAEPPTAVAPPVLAPAVASAMLQESEIAQSVHSKSGIADAIEANKQKTAGLANQHAKVENKLRLLQKRSKLRQLKAKLAEDKQRLSQM
jgi:hypothetical protein